ncbi:MAG: hypothetical protein NVS4B1_33390 [Ktedonobacteraceae bacterium]
MVFKSKDQLESERASLKQLEERKNGGQAIEASFGAHEATYETRASAVVSAATQEAKQAVAVKAAVADEELFGILPRFNKDAHEVNTDMCTVLFGYGIDKPDYVKYVDNFKFVGGVCSNVPRNIARAWKTGKRWQDDKPAVSRIYLQAILPSDANEVDYAKATGIQLMEPARLAAMIGATDAAALVKAMGAKQAGILLEELRKHI